MEGRGGDKGDKRRGRRSVMVTFTDNREPYGVVTYPEEVVHGQSHLQASVVAGLHDDVVGDEVGTQHEAEGD